MTTPPREYLDFELSIDARGDGQYEVAARTPTGDARATVTLAIPADVIESVVSSAHATWRGAHETREARRTAPAPDTEAALRDIGGRLFRSVLTDRVGGKYLSSYDLALSRKQGLRVRLRIQAPEIAALPWEYLFDPDREIFVARTNQTSIVRYVEVDQPAESLRVDFPLRILGVIAGPVDQAPLQKDAEKARMEEALADLCAQGLVQLSWARDGTYDALSDALGTIRPHILHFIGHGGFDQERGEGTLILEREDRSSLPLPAANLGELLLGGGTVRLVVLNSCEGARASGRNLFSSTAATVVRRGVPAVIAMQYPITDPAAVRFSHELYEQLAASQPVDRAVSSARLHLHTDQPRSPEWGTPVLFLQSSTGLLFSTGMHAIPDQEPRRRRGVDRTAIVPAAAALVGGSALAAWLAFTQPAMVDITGEVRTSEVAVRLDSTASFGASLPVSTMLASTFATIELPEPDAPHRIVREAPVSVTGNLQIDLSGPFAAGTGMIIRGAQGEYAIEWTGTLPAIGVTIDGTVTVLLDGVETTKTFTVPGRLYLRPSNSPTDTVTSELAIALAPGDSLVLGPFGADMLRFFRIERDFGEGSSPAREVPAIQAGTIRFRNGAVQPLGDGEDFRPRLREAAIQRVVLAGGNVTVRFNALVESGSWAPTRWSLTPGPLRVAWLAGAALFGGALGYGLTRQLSRKEHGS